MGFPTVLKEKKSALFSELQEKFLSVQQLEKQFLREKLNGKNDLW